MRITRPRARTRFDNHGPGRRLRPRYSARAFYLTCALLSVLAAISWLSVKPYHGPGRIDETTIFKRDASILESSDEECRLVHQAKDQCAFIKKHCPDEEPGFVAYLDLYYCRLADVKPIGFAILVAWLGVLFSTIGIAASDFFCINLSTIATILGMSESMAGVTFLAFGNGSPDVFSTFAAMSTHSSSLAIGELIGAACFITAVVAGSMALVRPFKVARKSFVRDVGFFIVAAAFSMGFLSDGKLHLWECIAMVAFYIFYVCFVVVWHWWISRRRRRREKENVARGHFVGPGYEELEVQEEYHDEEGDGSNSIPAVSRAVSTEDFSALENGMPRVEEPDPLEDDEEERDRWMGELSSNMRLSRPGGRSRRNTLTPIRPSLVGALEFQAVLKSLQKSRNIQTIPMHSRRYSDDPTYTTAQQQEQMSSEADPAARPPFEVDVQDDSGDAGLLRPGPNARVVGPNRARAVSANDAAGLQLDPSMLQSHARPSRNLIDIDEDENETVKDPAPSNRPASERAAPSPTFSISPAAPLEPRRDTSYGFPRPHETHTSAGHLAPPHEDAPRVTHHHQSTLGGGYTSSPEYSPRSRPQQPKLRIPLGHKSPLGSTPSSPFPAYLDVPSPSGSRPPSLYLPSASLSVDSRTLQEDLEEEETPLRWWPYSILPTPSVLISTLFPTLYHWHGKTWWEKMLGIVAAPSVFLLTVTLPVVEVDKDEEDEEVDAMVDPSLPVSVSLDSSRRKSITALEASDLQPSHAQIQNHGTSYSSAAGATGHGNSATVAAGIEQRHHHNAPISGQILVSSPTGDAPPHPHSSHPVKIWNRWLTMVQLFLSPVLMVLVLYTQYIPAETNLGRSLIRPCLIALLTSTVLLIPLLLTTTPTHRPPIYRTILSLAGFIVSIAWISTIASQVVALLKVLAVILNMSHTIMGLTVFAVGNSLGDLVADVTVARLGYPVMALSACFGGPMLNILLGIGLSGSWILIRGAERRHARHPDREVKFRTYEIEVGDTLIVSGITLLVTLVGLLVAVPLNKWMMSRRIAWSLIALWCVSTVVNVVIEVAGTGHSKEN